jgi:hypothetical protein
MQQRLGTRLQPFGQRVEHIGGLVHPAALLLGCGEHGAQRGPRAQRSVAGHQLGLAEPAVAQIAQHRRPRVFALAVAVLDGEQLLVPVFADADHDQHAHLGVLAEAHSHVDTVDEQVMIRTSQ